MGYPWSCCLRAVLGQGSCLPPHMPRGAELALPAAMAAPAQPLAHTDPEERELGLSPPDSFPSGDSLWLEVPLPFMIPLPNP